MHRKMSKKSCVFLTTIMMAVVLLFSSCAFGKEENDGELMELTETVEVQEGTKEEESEVRKESKAQEASKVQGETEEASWESEEICVHVCGRVVNPGVYMLPIGSRLYEAVDVAGGLCEDAASEQLNQAALIEDGQQIYVPSQEEAEQGFIGDQGLTDGSGVAGPGGKDTEDGKLNLNTASKEQLMTLNGIGEAKAAAIIRYREEHGGFQKLEELMEVEGIKEGVFNKVKDQIIV